jgi:hypothetical protein
MAFAMKDRPASLAGTDQSWGSGGFLTADNVIAIEGSDHWLVQSRHFLALARQQAIR